MVTVPPLLFDKDQGHQFTPMKSILSTPKLKKFSEPLSTVPISRLGAVLDSGSKLIHAVSNYEAVMLGARLTRLQQLARKEWENRILKMAFNHSPAQVMAKKHDWWTMDITPISRAPMNVADVLPLVEGSAAKLPQSWKDILLVVREAAPDAVIAGGALRDWDLGVTPRDLDIWTMADDYRAMKRTHTKLKRLGFRMSKMRDEFDEGDYPEEFGHELVCHLNGKHHLTGDMPVQIIGTSMPTQRIVDRFDFGICRIMYDGEYVWRANEYQQDRRNKVFRMLVTRNKHQMERSVARYARFLERYPKWRFEIDDRVYSKMRNQAF